MSDRDVGIASEEVDGVWVVTRHRTGYFRFSKSNPNCETVQDCFEKRRRGGSWTPEETLLFSTILRDW